MNTQIFDRGCARSWRLPHKGDIAVGFWQNGFFADFYFWAAGFFRRFSLFGFFLLIFVGKVPRKIHSENPRENPPKFIQQKSSNTFLQIAQGNINQLRPEGRNRRGETRLRGPEVLGPLRGLGIRPLVQEFGVSETPSQRPLRAPERLSGPRGRLFRGLGEACPFSKERGKKVGHSEAPKRPRFPGCAPSGFQPSGSYPQATDK